MTAAKTPAKTLVRTVHEVKPDYLVVEDHLKVQTKEGEKSLDLRIPLERLELFMDMEDIDEKRMPKYIRDEILWPEDRKQLVEMRDGAKALEITMRYAEEVGKRMGASLGESVGSTPSSDDTVEPSDTTSATPTE
jgi:hypothetical protein